MAGTYSEGGSTAACLPQTCLSRQISTMIAATTATEGCADCAVGTYVSGVSAGTVCMQMNCPAGQIATLTATTSSTQGCTDCAAGTYSPGGA